MHPANIVENLREIVEGEVEQGVNIVNIGVSRGGTGLVSFHQACEVFFDMFEDDFGYSPLDIRKRANNPSVVTVKVSAPLRSLNDHPLIGFIECLDYQQFT